MLSAFDSQDFIIIIILIIILLFVLFGSYFIEKFKDNINFGTPYTGNFDYLDEEDDDEKFEKIVLTPINIDNNLKILNLSEMPKTEEELTKAYYDLAKIYHPDKKSGDNEKFIKISKAYKELKQKFK